MAYSAYRHSRRKIKKAHYKSKDFSIRVRVVREPVYVRGEIYGQKVQREPAFVATACIGGGHSLSKVCATAKAHGPTAAVKRAVTTLAKRWR